MTAISLHRDLVVERGRTLPGFPAVVMEILATIDDPDANLKVLTDLVRLDPVIAGRVLSLANNAAQRTRSTASVRDVYSAASMIGLGRVRETALIGSMENFFAALSPAGLNAQFWQHSVAVGVCCEEIALQVSTPMSADLALITGLMHDIGQLWFGCFAAEAYAGARQRAASKAIGIDEVEQDRFGADHGTVGAWLAEDWKLPPGMCLAIRHHHAPDAAPGEAAVAVVHVAEVLSNALDLTGRDENRVTRVSKGACRLLGMEWNESVRPLFGRIEARSRHANKFFEPASA